MITKFILFETVNIGKPEIGDFVVVKETHREELPEDLNNFLDNNIGELVFISDVYHKMWFYVKYNNIPKTLETWFENDVEVDTRDFTIDEIIYWSEKKEDLKAFIKGKQFDL